MKEAVSPRDVPRVGIIVLNYNGKKCLSECLSSLQKLEYANFFVVVVDNDSSDGSFEEAERQFPLFSFERLTTNRGFAAGMNHGMTRALARGAEFVWIFNNDAQAAKDTLSLLVQAAQREPRAGLLSPCIFNLLTHCLWFGKARVQWLRMRVIHEEPTHRELQSDAYQSECLTGCALLLSKACIEETGGFDERFFLYYEDADLSLRAARLGFRGLVVPDARVYHVEQSQANPEKLYFLVFSGLLFFRKHSTGWRRPYMALYGTIRRLKNRLDVLRGSIGAASVRRAYNDFYHG